MKCLFCAEEIIDDNPICPNCGRRQRWTPDWKPEDTGWKCKNCGNFNTRTNNCSKCGKEKSFQPNQSPSIQSSDGINKTGSSTPNTPSSREMSPSFEDYMKEAIDKMLPLIKVLDEKGPKEYLDFVESHSSDAKAATTLLTLAWKAKPANQESSDAVQLIYLFVLAQLSLKNFKEANQWADYAAKSYPNEELSWLSKFSCGQFEAMDWAAKTASKSNFESIVLSGGWLGLLIGASTINQKQKQFEEKLAHPALKLSQIG
ncbi:MAG TPA: hypothetical protein PLR65_05565, partial [Anaerolineales bacterium]|nr:hypothetical protein [Anaerolineales bacterium]